jgi:hypothetical protein
MENGVLVLWQESKAAILLLRRASYPQEKNSMLCDAAGNGVIYLDKIRLEQV